MYERGNVMFKKFLPSVLVLILLASACMVPVSAAGLDDALIYDLRFSETGEAITDAQKWAYDFEIREGEVPIFYDYDVGMEVADILPETQLVVKGADIQDFENMTIEMYLKITNNSEDPVSLLAVTNSGVEIRAEKDSAFIGVGKGGEIEIDPFVRNEWFHLVCSIGKTEQVIYVNGEEVGRRTGETSFVGSTHSTYIGGNDENESGMTLAIYKFYEAAATAEDVAAMYQAVSNLGSATESPSASSDSEETPAPDATDSPTATATARPTTAPTAEPASDSGISGTTIAIIVVVAVVVIAAVVVILVVVSKKKKSK